MKIQNRIALSFTILTVGIILAFSVFIYAFSKRATENSFFHRLEVRSGILAHASLASNDSKTSIYQDIKEKHLGDLPDEEHFVLDSLSEGKLEEFKLKHPLPQIFYDNMEQKEDARFVIKDTAYVGLNISDKGKSVMIISRAVDLYGREELDNLKNLLIIGFLIAMVFVFTFARLFSRQVFNPIRAIIRNVKGISAQNLNQRLVVEGNNDEIYDLSSTFNEMLDRLEITFEMQNNFISNASHEFRTPLTIIRGEAELGLLLQNGSEEAKESLRMILKESDKLDHLTSSMLNLAQTGFDGKRDQWEKLRIDELIISVKNTIDQIRPENDVHVNFDELPSDENKLEFNGNATLLKAAFTNIILNSCKYSDNKPVSVKIGHDKRHIMLEVVDQGIGIPDREIGQIFVPFFRASNTNKYQGYGIGLPLTNNIIKMHHGSISVRSAVGVGTRFVVFLPSGS